MKTSQFLLLSAFFASSGAFPKRRRCEPPLGTPGTPGTPASRSSKEDRAREGRQRLSVAIAPLSVGFAGSFQDSSDPREPRTVLE